MTAALVTIAALVVVGLALFYVLDREMQIADQRDEG